MKRVFDHIVKRSKEFEKRPLFLYLRDTSIDPRERLRFVPCSAHFVMTFADLYHFFLTEEPPRDHYQQLVNTHLAEEGSHWKWFLTDLTALDLDPSMRFTDACRFIWSDETIRTRRLAYEVCKLSGGMTSQEKLVLVHSIEATGRVALEAAVPAGIELGARLGRNLVYFGGHHLDTERQHTLEGDDVHRALEETALDDERARALCGIVDQVFDHFAEFIDEAFDFARKGRGYVDTVAGARRAS